MARPIGVHPGAARAVTLYFLAPEDDAPWGGIRRIYLFVDVLNEAGIDAAVVHGESDFRCSWFENKTRVLGAEGLRVSARSDVLVIPEVYGPRLLSLAPGIPRMALVQNPYELYSRFPPGPGLGNLADAKALLGAVVVSTDSEGLLRHAFPGLPVHRIVYGVDTGVFYPGPKTPRTVAVMPRKRRAESLAVLGILRSRGCIERAGWRVVEIDSATEQEAAARLRASSVFLSFSDLEGFGLPPLEAMASGCLVAGFDGWGGREYFLPELTFPVPDGDLLGFATVVERLLAQLDAEPDRFQDRIRQAIEFVGTEYTMERQRETLLAAFGDLPDQSYRPAIERRLTDAEVRFEPDPSAPHRAVRRVREAMSTFARSPQGRNGMARSGHVQ
jgi:hypothetical protein